MELDLLTLIKTARELHDANRDLISSARKMTHVSPVLHRITQEKAADSLRGLIEPANGIYPIKLARITKPDFKNIYSLVFARRKEAIVEFSSSLNPCWTRFCVAKELLHLFVGCPNGTTTVSDHLKLAKQSRFVIPEKDNAKMDDETFCLYLAIEVMLPWSMRMELIDMHAAGDPPLVMAKRFMVPCAIIEHYFDCGYGEISYRLNNAV